MLLLHDRTLTISTAGSRKATSWSSTVTSWSDLAQRLSEPLRGAESYDAYMRMPKATQDALKDAGGFVGGSLRNGRRTSGSCIGRDVVTLDLDAIPAGGTDTVMDRVKRLGAAYAIYSTRKHAAARPRLRVVLPLDRTVTADEYEPIARRIGERVGIDCCDPTTFQALRLMYWPSCCADGEYIYDVGDAPMLRADEVLASYRDWHNISEWPQVTGVEAKQHKAALKAEDPTTKKGVIGAFCRVYTVQDAIAEFLSDEYVPAEGEDRYTYALGSTTSGAIVYDDKFLYSHHSTDPCSEMLCNAWDLVRIHRYGAQDSNAAPGTPVVRLPSTKAMTAFASTLAPVKREMLEERMQAVAEDFSLPSNPEEEAEAADFSARLKVSDKGGYVNSSENMLIILNGDPRVRGKIAFDRFNSAMMCMGSVPWNDDEEARLWTDADDAGLRIWMESTWGMQSREKVSDAVTVTAQKNSYDEVVSYLNGLRWDGKQRIDTLLHDYLLADDTPYVRAVTRKTLVAAVARALDPGCKFDTVLTLIGAQGSGKSTFIDILGGQWYSDSIQTFEGKEAAEQLRGVWLAEIPEVDRFSKWESSVAKQFITRRDDSYREAYGRRITPHPRRCVFIATTNAADFLPDTTGNRRWWIVRCNAGGYGKKLGASFEKLKRERDQIWAEAMALWRIEEPLTLEAGLTDEAIELQQNASFNDEWTGIIERYLEQLVPEDWEKWTPQQRMAWSSDDFAKRSAEAGSLVPITRVCAIQIQRELLGIKPGDTGFKQTKRINAVLDNMPGWERKSYRSPIYGVQRGYVRVEEA